METIKSFAFAETEKELANMPLARRALAWAVGMPELRRLARDKAVQAELAERDELIKMIEASEMSGEQMLAAKSHLGFASTQALLSIALFALGMGDFPKIAGLQEDSSLRDCQRMANEARRLGGQGRAFWTGAPFCGPMAAALNERVEKRAASLSVK